MTDIRTIMLAGKPFPVPPLPLRASRVVYPLCRKLSFTANPADPGERTFVERFMAASGSPDCVGSDYDDLMDIIFHSINAGGAGLTRDEFELLPVKPHELSEAFFAIRYQTGGWIEVSEPVTDDPPGEAKRAPRPRTNRRQK